MSDKLVLTFDLDWCKDDVLEYLLQKLIPKKIPATFFVTHYTKLLDKIRKYNFFELGIHPNFNSNSTHGNNDEDIIRHCLSIVPEAISSRSHGLNISSDRLILLMKKGIKYDCSIMMPNVKKIQKFYFEICGNKILRIPYNWEDDYEFYQKNKKYELASLDNFSDKILDFHPIHVYLNSSSNKLYEMYKKTECAYKGNGLGAEAMLDNIIHNYESGNISIVNLRDYIGKK